MPLADNGTSNRSVPTTAIDPALERALLALQPQLRRFAYGLCGSLDDADDLVQSAYERALQRLDQWREGSRLDSWMYRIVQSIHFNRYRADKVRSNYLRSIDPAAETQVDAATVAAGQIALDRVRDGVWTLPIEQRTCLLLVVVEGLAYREAAAVLDIPVGTLTSRLARARLALRSCMDGQSESEHSPHTSDQDTDSR